MALTRPILITPPAFDATKEYIFTFSTYGGDQVVANRLIIRNNDTNATVYDEKQETFQYQHIVNANELTNGTYYNASLTTFNATDEESAASTTVQFWCYADPEITFTNIPSGGYIEAPSFDFEFTYNQAQGEALNLYVVNLYNSSQELLSTSGNIYVENGDPVYAGNYLFAGFENATDYFIELTVTTIESTVISTGLIPFTVRYSRPDLFSLVELQNNCDEGYITLTSNIVLIEGENNPDPPTFIDNKEVDLTESGSYVEWNKGYNITGDMLTRMWLRNPTPYSTLLTFSNASGQTITVKYMLGYQNVNAPEMQSYFTAEVTSIEGFVYYIYSNYMDTLSSTEYYCVWLKRINNIYSLEIGQATV